MLLSDAMRKHKKIIDNEIKLNKYKFENKDYKGLCLGKQFIFKSYILLVEQLEKELIDKLIKLYKVNQNINEIIKEHNNKSKDKIFLNVLDLMEEVEIEDLLEKILNKSWEEIIKDNKLNRHNG